MKDQMPAGGCANCGKHEGETQSTMRKNLKRVNSLWLCQDCAKAEA